MLDSSHNIESEQVDAKVGLLFGGNDAQYFPASSTAVQAGIRQGLGEDNVHDLLSEQQLAALFILDDVGNGSSSSASRLGVRASEVFDDGQNALVSEGDQLGVGGWFDSLDGHWVGTIAVGSVSSSLAHSAQALHNGFVKYGVDLASIKIITKFSLDYLVALVAPGLACRSTAAGLDQSLSAPP